MSVSATKRLATSAKITVKASCLKSWPATPTTNIMGKNTTTVVRVDAVMALETSVAPATAASFSLVPSSLCREIFSRTTMALSTSIPTPRARPPRLIMFIESFPMYMKVKTAIIEMGMLKVTIVELFTFRRKNRSTKNAKMPPWKAAFLTPFIESFIKVDWSYTISIFKSFGIANLITFRAFFTRFTTCRVFACACFWMDMEIFSLISYREKLVLSLTVS